MDDEGDDGPVMPGPGVPLNADDSEMTRAELLEAAWENSMRWARTATTDEPPEGFNRQFARSDAYFRKVLERRDAEQAARASNSPDETGGGR